MFVEFQVHSLADADLQPSSEVLHSLLLTTGNEIEDRSDTTFGKAGWAHPQRGSCYASLSVATLEGPKMSHWN